jgi:hypothetical protein
MVGVVDPYCVAGATQQLKLGVGKVRDEAAMCQVAGKLLGAQVRASLSAEVAVNDAALHEVEGSRETTTLPILRPVSTYR